MGKEKRAEAIGKQCFQMQCFHFIYTVHLHYFTLKRNNNIRNKQLHNCKTKQLFTIYEKF